MEQVTPLAGFPKLVSKIWQVIGSTDMNWVLWVGIKVGRLGAYIGADNAPLWSARRYRSR